LSGDDQDKTPGTGTGQDSDGGAGDGGYNPGAGEDQKTGSMLEKVEARKKELDQKLDAEKKPDKPEITSKFVQDCLYANELGDGMLAAALFKDRFLFNKSSDEWLKWEGHHWDRDIMARSKASVENVAQEYLSEASRIVGRIGEAIEKKDRDTQTKLQDVQDKIYKRVGRLRSERGRTNTLKFAHTNIENQISIKGDELDLNPWLLACKNGVIDLRTGELRPGRPEDLISKASPMEFTGIDTPAPAWEMFLKEILVIIDTTEKKEPSIKEHPALVDYVARLFGYGITGQTVEHFLPILHGQGRNGKGVLIETISSILGGYMGPIQSEMLLDQGRVKNSAGPSPDIMALRGLRIAFASETDQGRRFSTSRVKWLTGGDTLKGRYPHDKYETEFSPTHTLILMTNSKPDVSDDDFAFWERVHLVPFELSFVEREPEKFNERPADKYLREKLLAEAPGILAWLVRGCLEWQRVGLNPPPVVIDATKEYRRDEDLLGHFLKECCYEDPGTESTAKELYDRFREWWQVNVSRKVLSQKKFGGMMVKKFNRSKSGTYRYFGVGLLPDWEKGE
jgi:putative DNA primase/helicase